MLIRIKNLIDEVYKKVAKWLTTEYRVIFFPTFESSQMVGQSGKKKSKLNSKTVRQMIHWVRNRFKQTLKFHGLKRGATLIDVTEEYTSKTYTKCGHVHQNLGCSKYVKFPHCDHSMPRDRNGALGIFIKELRDTANVDSSAVTLL
ncbi:MAG: transposase [Trichodesmium sp. MAG_R03]|nr:transposase [Trichodesmium sp. MAG_R03]